MSKGYITEQELSEDLKKKINENPSSVKEIKAESIKTSSGKSVEEVLNEHITPLQGDGNYTPVYSKTKLNLIKSKYVKPKKNDIFFYKDNYIYLIRDYIYKFDNKLNLIKKYDIIDYSNILKDDNYIYLLDDSDLYKYDINTFKMVKQTKIKLSINEFCQDKEHLYILTSYYVLKISKSNLNMVTEESYTASENCLKKIICVDNNIYLVLYSGIERHIAQLDVSDLSRSRTFEYLLELDNVENFNDKYIKNYSDKEIRIHNIKDFSIEVNTKNDIKNTEINDDLTFTVYDKPLNKFIKINDNHIVDCSEDSISLYENLYQVSGYKKIK